MTSAADVIEMGRRSDGVYVQKRLRRAAHGNLVPASVPGLSDVASNNLSLTQPSTLTGGVSAEQAILAGILGDAGGTVGLTFGQQSSIEAQRQQGDVAIAGIQARVAELIARLQEAGATGRTQFTTEAEARAGAHGAGTSIVQQLLATLAAQGFAAPGVALGDDPASAAAALAAALREGTVFPTEARQARIAEASANPSDIVRLLALTAGRETLTPSETELQKRTAFNLPGVVEEGVTARGRLAGTLEQGDFSSFQDLLDRFLPLVEPPEPVVDTAALIQDAINQALAGIGGGGGGGGGAGGGTRAGRAFTGDVNRQATPQELNLLRGRGLPAQGTTAPSGPGTTLTPRAAAQRRVSETNVAFERAHALAIGGRGQEAIRLFTPVVQGLNLQEALALQQRMRTIISEGNPRLRSFSNSLTEIVATRIELLQGIRRGRLAKGGVHFDPGFFLIGEGKGGVKRGSAEFAYLAPGSVIAPMKQGERPTMDSARQAVAEMLFFGRRGKKGESVPEGEQALKKLGHGGVTVVSGDTLWTIIQRLGGDPTRWQEVARAIGLADPRFLQIGTLIPFEVLAGVGANVPAAPAPAPPPAPAPAPTPSPAPTPAPAPAAPAPAPAPVAPGPEAEQAQKIITDISGLLGGLVGESLQGNRSISELLAGVNLAPNAEFLSDLEKLGISAPDLPNFITGPATQFPFSEFTQLPDASRQAVQSLIQSFAGKDVTSAILGLHGALRGKAFSGGGQLALSR